MRKNTLFKKAFSLICGLALAAGSVFVGIPVQAATSTGVTYSTVDAVTWEQQGENVWTAKKADGTAIATVTRNGNVWTYDFNVVDADAQYYVYEQMADTLTGYTSAGSDGNAATTSNPGVVTAGEDTQEYTITNSKEHAGVYSTGDDGALKITKQVEGTTVSSDRKFTFTITLSTDDETLAKKISGSKIFGGVPFVDGVATISLASGEAKQITRLPAGISYTVVEADENDFSSTVTNGAGVIVKDEITSVTCINTANENHPADTTTSFKIAKVVDSNGDSSDQAFTFNVSLTGLKPQQEYQLNHADGPDGTYSESYYADDNGNADFELTMKGGDIVTVADIPTNSTYSVTEQGGDYTSSFELTDANGQDKILQESGFSTDKNTALSTRTETAEDGEDVTVTFTNKIVKTIDLKLSKKSVDGDGNDMDDDAQYTVDIEFSGLDPDYAIQSTKAVFVADSDGIAEGALYISSGETITFFDVPVGTTYKFTEEKSDKRASYTVVDANNKNSIVQASGENTKSKTALSTATETADDDEDVTVTFTNQKMKAAKIKVEKYENSTSKKKLGGAEFDMYYSNGTPVNFTTDSSGNASNHIVINSNGESDLLESDLFVAGDYYLVETKAPEGFGVTGENINFAISDEDLGETIVLKVYDNKIIVMPETGSNNMLYILLAAGALIVAGTSFTMIGHRKKRASITPHD